ncbi:MAG: hypothetical protein KKD99_00140 [Proteobacteria bacterium]|nr:hypothetical protein [Pseudomonadota bacterium]
MHLLAIIIINKPLAASLFLTRFIGFVRLAKARRPSRLKTPPRMEEAMRNTRYWLMGILLVVLGLVLLGCASSSTSLTPQVQGPQTTEQLLSAAGFKQIYPSTPAQKAKLSNMPQKQIFLISKGPKVYYVYADASGCGCLYAGNQQKYQNFMNLATQAQFAAERYQAAQMEAWDWGTWGPGWWGETGEME